MRKFLLKNNLTKLPTYGYQIHIDYIDFFYVANFLIIVNTYTKWFEVITTNLTSLKTAINLLRTLFAQFGLSVTTVSDNPQLLKPYQILQCNRSNRIIFVIQGIQQPMAKPKVQKYQNKNLKLMMDDPQPLNVKLYRLLLSRENLSEKKQCVQQL